ncbi:MAG TPA: NAD(P)-binding protein [Candidatus Alectryocaccobium stercorigallinarum]|nr:NAD(P)-binding protein [Candidatus Alectryocaccobium stercorigallinarum]
MLRITQIKIPVWDTKTKIEDRICGLLHIKKEKLLSWEIVRRSVEARRRETLSYVYTVNVHIKNEQSVLIKNRNKNISAAEAVKYVFPKSGEEEMALRPVIIGTGPAGLFCAYFLALNGYRPVVLERGEKADERVKSVIRFWENGVLNTESNVQFGEGGAGTFSDGKLNTGVTDRYGRNRAVLELFVKHGAPRGILYDAKPHVGTDILCKVIANIRNEIISLGGTFCFNTRADEICIENGRVSGVRAGDKMFDANVCVAAVGHSARDTFKMLSEKNVRMEPKAFAVGVRVQHPQEFIDKAQWGEDAPASLGAAPYKLSAQLLSGRNVYTFCMCPGGYVVNASSEKGRLAVNGMSYSGRASGYANSAVIVSVTPDDYLKYSNAEMPEALSAVAFQRELEERAFSLSYGKIPVQTFGAFKQNRTDLSSEYEPCTKGSWEYADVKSIFPKFINESLENGLTEFGKKLAGFDTPDMLMLGVESRTSSPVRIVRDESFQSNINGLYPCGEGAGYAGGIMSAAIDGIKVAEAIASKYKRPV